MKFLNFNKLKYKTQQKAPNSFSNNMETLNVLRSSYIVKAVRFTFYTSMAIFFIEKTKRIIGRFI